MRNSVVPVMPTATLADPVILSPPPTGPTHPPHLWNCVSQVSLPAPLHPRSTPTTPRSTSPARHAISGPTTRLGSACMRLPVSMCELNLVRNTSLQIHASERTLMNVFSARHTGACVCVCALRHMFVCVCVHMYVFACVLAFHSPPWPTLHWGYSTSLFFRALLIKFWFSFVQACVCVRVSWCDFSLLGLGMQSQATSQKFSVLVLT